MLSALLASTVFSLAAGSPPAAPPPQDPVRERFERDLRAKLRDHPYLARVRLAEVWAHPPFLYLVQEPEGAEAGYAGEVASRRHERIGALHLHFQEAYVEPMSLHLRPDGPRLVVVLLATEAAFAECTGALRKGEPVRCAAWYGVEERFLYLCEDPAREPSPDDLHVAMREAAHLVVHGHGPRIEGPLTPPWWWAGIADDLGAHAATGPGAIPGPSLAMLVDALHRPAAREAYLLPLSALLAQPSPNAVVRLCAGRVPQGSALAFDENEALAAFQAMSGVLFHYLAHDAPGEVPARTRVFSELAIKNRLARRSLGNVLAGVDLGQLEQDFWLYAWKAARRASPSRRLDASQLGDFLTERGWSGGAGDAIETSGPAGWLEGLIDGDAHLALALARARSGDFEGGVALLESSPARELSKEYSERIDRELGRLRAWIDLRARFFASLAGGERPFSFDHEGKRLTAAVEAVEAGGVRFAENRRGIESLAWSEIDQVELGRRMRDRKYGFEAGWAGVVPCVLAFDPKASRFLRGDSPEANALKQDAESDYPRRRAAIELAETLVALEELDPLASPDAARSALPLIREAWSRKGKVAFVSKLEADLRALAEASLVRIFEADGLDAALAGEAKRLDGGRVQLTYDFADGQQLRDWVLQENAGQRHAEYPALQREDASFACTDNKLVGVGQTSLTHRLHFEGPQSIRWKNKMLSEGEGEAQKEMTFEVALCGGPRGARVAVVNLINLDVVAAKAGTFHRQSPEEVKVRFDQAYEVELEHDGKNRVVFRREGQEIFTDECRGCVSGAVHLWLHSDYAIEFDDLEITGRPTEGSLATLREAWVAGQLAELGF